MCDSPRGSTKCSPRCSSLRRAALPATRPRRLPGCTAAAPRLAPLLAEDIAGRRISVRDEAHRSIVTVPAERLFEAESTQPSAEGAALLARIAAALAGQTGKVVVIGHTDGRDARTARLPSAWHQSFEWAREVADALGQRLPAERLAVEGAADLDDPGQASQPRRRVDIVLHP